MTRSPHTPAPADEAVTGPVIGGDALVAYESMLASVPDVSDDNVGYERILDTLASARSLDDLEAPWRSRGGEAYLNQWLIIRGIRKAPSDFRGGLPWFLIVDAELADGGEPITFTTGSVNVVGQLVRAHTLDLFPLEAMLVESERQTAAGYKVQRLTFRRD